MHGLFIISSLWIVLIDVININTNFMYSIWIPVKVHQIQQEVKSQESTNKLHQNGIQQLQMKIKTQENKLLAQGNIIAKLERKYEGNVIYCIFSVYMDTRL